MKFDVQKTVDHNEHNVDTVCGMLYVMFHRCRGSYAIGHAFMCICIAIRKVVRRYRLNFLYLYGIPAVC